MANFYAINSKIGVLRRGIFDNDDYEKILSFTEKSEFLDFCRNNPLYKNEFSNIDDYTNIQRYAIENMIVNSEVKTFKKLRSFLTGVEKDILDIIMVKYVFDDIKLILRSIVENEKIDLEKDTHMYGIETYVSYDELIKCENISQAIDILRKTPFKKAFMGLTDEYFLRLHFHVEMNLDNLYFSLLKKGYDKLLGKSKVLFEKYYTSLADTINIQWIIRAKKYYNLPNEEIYAYCLRYGKHIKGEFLKSLVYSEDVNSVFEKLKSTKFSTMISYKKEITNYRNIQGYVYEKQLKSLKSYQNNISTVLKFIIEVIMQNENLIRIAESQKYKLEKEEIKRFLINVA